MKRTAIYLACILMLAVFSPLGFSQDKAKSDDKPAEKSKTEVATTPVKVQVVFTEFEADKKVKSLPYTLYTNSSDSADLKPGWTKLRIGSRVPVSAGKDQWQYVDVGTNIDARGAYFSEGHLWLQLSLERSWVEGDIRVPGATTDSPQSEAANGPLHEPIIRSFKSELDLKLREGQAVESTVAADPISGRLVKVEVSFTTVK
jgi:hypothetical protein